MGLYEGTIDKHHLPDRNPHAFQAMQKLKARVLYAVDGQSPPQFALSALEHVLGLGAKCRAKAKAEDEEEEEGKEEEEEEIQTAYPVGTIVHSAKVIEVIQDHGLAIEVDPGIYGFVHVCCFYFANFSGAHFSSSFFNS